MPDSSDFSPQPLDRARFVIDCLAPNGLILSPDSFDYARLSLSDADLLNFKSGLVEAVRAGRGQAFSLGAELAEKLAVPHLSVADADLVAGPGAGLKRASFSEVFKQIGLG